MCQIKQQSPVFSSIAVCQQQIVKVIASCLGQQEKKARWWNSSAAEAAKIAERITDSVSADTDALQADSRDDFQVVKLAVEQ